MAVDNIYSAVLKILQSNTKITGLLAFYPSSSIPIINSGVLHESVTALPALTLEYYPDAPFNKVVKAGNITINCFAENQIDSSKIADVIINELDDTNETIDGFSIRFKASGLPSTGDPTAKEINSPVSLRVEYWR